MDARSSTTIEDYYRNYPLIAGNLGYTAQMTLLKERETALKEEQCKMEEFIKSVQAACPHETFVKDMTPDKTYIWSAHHRPGHVEEVMKGKTCTACGLFKLRPVGQHWNVCYKCGGKMKDDGVEPGQGERTYHFSCEDCGHHVTHT